MTQLSNYGENKVADFYRGQGLTLPTNWYLAPGSAADDASFTEITGIGLTRATVARSLTAWAGTQGPGTTLASTGTSHSTSNNAAISFGAPTGSATMTHVGFFDAPSGGNCWIWVPVPGGALSITSGSPATVQIAAGAMSLSYGASGGCTDYLANKMIDLIFRGQAFTWPATIYFAYFTAAPTNAGGGTEASGGAYARVALVPSLTSLSGTQSAGSTAASSGTAGRVSNNAAITFPAPTADQGTAQAMGVLDASTVGNLLVWHALTSPQTISNGGPAPRFAANAFGITVG